MRQARSRGWDWEITEEDAYAVLEKQEFKCALSGLSLTFKPQTASLDRVDSKRHYTPDNIQWVANSCHKIYGNLGEPRQLF